MRPTNCDECLDDLEEEYGITLTAEQASLAQELAFQIQPGACSLLALDLANRIMANVCNRSQSEVFELWANISRFFDEYRREKPTDEEKQ